MTTLAIAHNNIAVCYMESEIWIWIKHYSMLGPLSVLPQTEANYWDTLAQICTTPWVRR